METILGMERIDSLQFRQALLGYIKSLSGHSDTKLWIESNLWYCNLNK